MSAWIVIAWLDTVSVWDGESFTADLGERPAMIERQVARACIWMRSDCDSDVERARAHVQGQYPTGHVYRYPARERDPLGRAQRDCLARLPMTETAAAAHVEGRPSPEEQVARDAMATSAEGR